MQFKFFGATARTFLNVTFVGWPRFQTPKNFFAAARL